MMTYKEQLLDPRWQKKRLEVLNRDDFTCQQCHSKEKTLHVHHLYYVSGRMAWEYPMVTYLTICDECHKGIDPTKALPWERGLSMMFSMLDEMVSPKVIPAIDL